MRKTALISGALALLLGLVGIVSIAAAPAAKPSARSRTLTFDVQFSPFTLIPANPIRGAGPIALGDEITFHDTLFSKGKRVGDEVGSCVVVAVATPGNPDILANCSEVMRLRDGNIAAQFANVAGPTPKDLAVTGGTGAYRDVGGDGRLVEFGNAENTGRLTLHLLSLSREGDT
jgi:hypothetical protein